MLFNSIQFFVFFVVVTTAYFALPHRFRWSMLLLASCLFYMAFIPQYILILFVTIVIDYVAALYIEKSSGKTRKTWLIVSIISTCLVLFIFKYFNFFNANFEAIAHFLHWNYPIGALKLILPIGLSFHTFQSLSYVIEVYRGKQKAEHNFGIYSLYVMFYPQLVAGPIERPQNLLHQFHERHDFNYEQVVDGLKLMLWGLFKKIVIADSAAMIVNHIYDNPQGFTGLPLIIATIVFAFQIFCDFSGYSDIAIGSALVMGFRLSQNFNRPYFSKSISEFWKRWHISLSTWFKDYVYIPLGGNRVRRERIYFNIFITFLLSGLWHGANWTYVVWGALNGIYLIVSILTEKLRDRTVRALGLNKVPKLHRFIQILITFSLICFSWIFFRARNMNDAVYIVSHLFYMPHLFSENVFSQLGVGMKELLIVVGLIAILETVHLTERETNIRNSLASKPAWVRWGVYYIVVAAIVFYMNGSSPSQFIYFQF